MYKRYFNLFQILRVIAFIVIYIYHNTARYDNYQWAVCVFLMMSGFLEIVHRYEDLPEAACGEGIGQRIAEGLRYGVKKISKLYPVHVITTLTAAVLYIAGHIDEIRAALPTSIVQHVVMLISNILLISDWFPSAGSLRPYFSEYNIPVWFFSLCFFIYMFVPLIIRVMRRIYGKDISISAKAYLKPLTVIAVIYAYTIAVNLIHVRIFGTDGAFWYNYESVWSRIGDFLIGAQLGVIYLIWSKKHSTEDRIGESTADMQSGAIPDKTGFVPIAVFAIASLFNIIFYIWGVRLDDAHVWLTSTGFIHTIPVGCLILTAAIAEGSIRIRTSHPLIRPIMALGGLTYYMYLIHVPVIYGVHGIYERITEVNNAVFIAISAVLTIILALCARRIFHGKGSGAAPQK